MRPEDSNLFVWSLNSFPACYAAEFRPIEAEKKGGIPLEHVISCVPGVEIVVSKAGVKVIQFQQNREPFYGELFIYSCRLKEC